MDKEQKNITRKKFLFWGVGLSSILALPAFLRFRPGKKNTKTVRMLTQDGKLVEVDVTKISGKKKKIRDADIHTWVNKKSSSL